MATRAISDAADMVTTLDPGKIARNEPSGLEGASLFGRDSVATPQRRRAPTFVVAHGTA